MPRGSSGDWSEEELDSLFELGDKDGNGVLSYGEFVESVHRAYRHSTWHLTAPTLALRNIQNIFVTVATSA